MHDYMVPPEDVRGFDVVNALWKTEFDVTTTLAAGHDVYTLGLADELGAIRQAINEVKPHVAFNLMEAFHEVGTFDQNVVSHLELLRLRYTGCNPRGLILSRDKALAKKVLAYDGIPVPAFAIFPIGRVVRRPSRLRFPLIVSRSPRTPPMASRRRRWSPTTPDSGTVSGTFTNGSAPTRSASSTSRDASCMSASSATSGCTPSRSGR